MPRRMRIPLIIFLTLVGVTAMLWLFVWFTGYRGWAGGIAIFLTAVLILLLSMIVASVCIDAITAALFGPIRSRDDRGAGIALLAKKDRVDDAEWRELKSEVKSLPKSRSWRITLAMLVTMGSGYAAKELGSYLLEGELRFVPFLIVFPISMVIFWRYASRIQSVWIARAFVRIGRCGGCGYCLAEVPRQSDGCRVCPECGVAWKIGSG